jgi:hypothetical protein
MKYEIILHGEEYALIDENENVLAIGTENECMREFNYLFGDNFLPNDIGEALDNIDKELSIVV